MLAIFNDGTFVMQATKNHHPLLVDVLCKEMKCKWEEVTDFDLHLTDTQPAVSQTMYSQMSHGTTTCDHYTVDLMDNICM